LPTICSIKEAFLRHSNENLLDLSITIPLFNEVESIESLLVEILEVVRPLCITFEILIVDDGSRDGSVELLKKLKPSMPELGVLVFRKNSGQAAAFDAGFQHVRGKVVITMDADGQNDPHDIPRLISKLNEGFDVVTGWRKNRKDGFIIRRFPSIIANWIIRRVTKTRIHDLGCSLRAYKKEITKELRLYGETHRFICPLAENLGARIAEIEVHHRPRRAGVSKYGLSRTLKVILDLIHVWFLRNYQSKPIYVFGGMGLICGFLSFICTVLTAYDKFHGIYVHRNPLFLIAIILIMLAFQFLGVGLLAELMTRVYFESQNKTAYSIVERIGSGDT
jgi:glycosyltransferase involved in cell wall biosynthesis